MYKTFYIVLLSLSSLLASVTVVAQYQGNSCNSAKSSSIIPVAGTFFYNPLPSKKEQFYNDWQSGKIWFVNQKQSDTVKIRYNSWLDEVMWLRTSDYKTATVIKGNVVGFETFPENGKPAQSFIKITDYINFVRQDIFVEVLAKGKISLYCHRKVVYNKGNNSFSNSDQYFIDKGGVRSKVTLRKKSFYSALSLDEGEKLKVILKENHLKLKDETQLAKAIDLFNQAQ